MTASLAHALAIARGQESVECWINGRGSVLLVDALPSKLSVVAQSLSTTEWHDYRLRRAHFTVNGAPADGRTVVRKGDQLTLSTDKRCRRCCKAAWRCRRCGARCCEHLCGFKKPDGTASCGACQRRAR
jgi:hypothetical protein